VVLVDAEGVALKNLEVEKVKTNGENFWREVL
jgi:hypothetical protein